MKFSEVKKLWAAKAPKIILSISLILQLRRPGPVLFMMAQSYIVGSGGKTEIKSLNFTISSLCVCVCVVLGNIHI